MCHTFLTTIFVWWAWAPRTMHGSNSTQGPLWWIALKLFWDPLALCVWRRPRDNTNTGGHMGLLNKENAPHSCLKCANHYVSGTFLVPKPTWQNLQNPKSRIRKSKFKIKIQIPKHPKFNHPKSKNPKFQNSKIKKSEIKKSKIQIQNHGVFLCVYLCLLAPSKLHWNYLLQAFFWGGVHTFFCDVKCIFGGGYLQIMQKCMKRFPSKKSRQREKCIHRWPPPPPRIYISKGVGLQDQEHENNRHKNKNKNKNKNKIRIVTIIIITTTRTSSSNNNNNNNHNNNNNNAPTPRPLAPLTSCFPL